MLIPFTKAHGTGNSFIIIYLSECPELELNENMIQTLCKGQETDGLLLLSDHKEYDFKMDYYNNDGTWETMCANGARCAGFLLYEKKIMNKKGMFITGDGEHKIKIKDSNNIATTIFPPQYTSDEIFLDELSGFSINSGAKHFVVEVHIDANLEWEKIGKKIRNSDYFSPYGTNVNFVKKISNSILEVITYEKGVEAIMESCGSGSVAAAYHIQQKYNLSNNFIVHVRGGKLSITADSKWKEVWLQGPVKLLYSSTIDSETLSE